MFLCDLSFHIICDIICDVFCHVTCDLTHVAAQDAIIGCYIIFIYDVNHVLFEYLFKE